MDWDVSIREQMKLVSDAVRNLTKTPETQSAPYGRDWDVLWIGHCGEYWEESFETILFEDPAVCPHSKYLGWAKQYIERLPDYRRAAYRSFNRSAPLPMVCPEKELERPSNTQGMGKAKPLISG